MRDLFVIVGYCLLLLLGSVFQGLGFFSLWETETIVLGSAPKKAMELYHYDFENRAKEIPNINDVYLNSVPQFYKTSRDLLFLFLVFFFIFSYLVIKEYFLLSQREIVGQERVRIHQELELKTRQAMRQKIAEKDRQLTVVTVALEEKNKMLSGIKLKLNDLKSKSETIARNDLASLSYTIDRNLDSKGDWIQFQQHFSQLHPSFFAQLKKKYPHLRPNDLRICAYQRMNFTIAEMAKLLHINQGSVQKARYRLKKKLELNVDQNLESFLAQF